jgi:transcription antitermination factor NusG
MGHGLYLLDETPVNWYALHVRSNNEHQVAEKLEYAGIEAFYPFKLEMSRDKRREIEKKFMPGYVFGRFSLQDKTPVVAIPQVVSILGWGRHAVAIPDFEIEAVRKIVSFPSDVKACEYLAEGALVRVKWGALAGLEGYVIRAKKNQIVVSVTMLGRSISARVDPDSLEPFTRAVELPKAA